MATSSANIEVLILVLGQAGCGKSLFINSAANKDEKSNGGLDACTEPRTTICRHPTSPRRFTLIEAPGFNNTKLTPSDSDILVQTAELMKKKFSGHKFGGILYLQQRGQKMPMLTELLGNDVMKENLLQVVTILGPSSGDSSEQGELCFQNTPDISERNVSAWKIIDKVYQKVECKNLTVGVVQPGFETAWRGIESKKGGKLNSRAWSWFSFLFR